MRRLWNGFETIIIERDETRAVGFRSCSLGSSKLRLFLDRVLEGEQGSRNKRNSYMRTDFFDMDRLLERE